MRDICFRAKPIGGGHWIEGYYEGFTICMGQNDEGIIHRFSDWGLNIPIAVDSKTVCQFTGLQDKNGTEIWENDIVEIDDDIVNTWKVAKLTHVRWMPATGFCPFNLDANYANKCRVIGNFFDNPELLEVK
jgi:uncharacterized phage protein (TIGR01671 family)